jgi:uncharacterized protein Yka (UPF0111/DUF47 family)
MVRLIPKDTSFFKMFSAMSDNLIAGARTLVDLFADYKDVDIRIEEIHRIEREGDELTHAILTKLNPTFITPFDREDIHELASKLDDVLDFINASGAAPLCTGSDSTPAAAELANHSDAKQELQKAVSLMQNNGNIWPTA